MFLDKYDIYSMYACIRLFGKQLWKISLISIVLCDFWKQTNK